MIHTTLHVYNMHRFNGKTYLERASHTYTTENMITR